MNLTQRERRPSIRRQLETSWRLGDRTLCPNQETARRLWTSRCLPVTQVGSCRSVRAPGLPRLGLHESVCNPREIMGSRSHCGGGHSDDATESPLARPSGNPRSVGLARELPWRRQLKLVGPRSAGVVMRMRRKCKVRSGPLYPIFFQSPEAVGTFEPAPRTTRPGPKRSSRRH
jgi:hypothetical protein